MSYSKYKNGKLETIAGTQIVDTTLSTTSTNAVSNSAVTNKVNELNQTLGELEYSNTHGGKNLFSGHKIGVGLNASNGNEIVSATASTSDFIAVDFRKNANYKLSGLTDSLNSLIFAYDENKSALARTGGAGRTDITLAVNSFNSSVIKTPTSDNIKYIRLEMYEGSGKIDTVTSLKTQLEVGNTATDYEPYIPSVKMLAEETADINSNLGKLGKCKNLLEPQVINTTVNGVTWSSNNGIYNANGTASGGNGTVSLKTNIKANTKYKLVGCPSGGTDSTYRMSIVMEKADGSWSTYYDYGNGVEFTNNKDYIATIYLSVFSGKSAPSNPFKPMLVVDTLYATYNDFVPYTGNGETLTHDVSQLNDSLGDYNLDDKLNGNIESGYYDETNGSKVANNKYVRTVTPLECGANSVITVKNDYNFAWIVATYWNGNTFISKDNKAVSGKHTTQFIAPIGATNVNFHFMSNDTISPSIVGRIVIYVNNAIDEIKADFCGIVNLGIKTNPDVTHADIDRFTQFGDAVPYSFIYSGSGIHFILGYHYRGRDYGSQLMLSFSGGSNMKSRRCDNGTWGSWA